MATWGKGRTVVFISLTMFFSGITPFICLAHFKHYSNSFYASKKQKNSAKNEKKIRILEEMIKKGAKSMMI